MLCGAASVPLLLLRVVLPSFCVGGACCRLLQVDAVKTVLTKFANNHLNRVGVTITDPGSDMRSGVALLMLLQLVGKLDVY